MSVTRAVPRIGGPQIVNYTGRLHQTRRMHSETLEGIPEAKRRHVPTSGTYPRGFLVSGTHVGIKPSNKDKPDLAIIRSTQPCTAAAIFTQNVFAAAPVTVSQRILEETTPGSIRNVIINSGKANAVTGNEGMACAESMVLAVNEEAHKAGDVGSATLVMSTGVIGQPLPTEKIVQAVPGAFKAGSDSHSSWFNTACSIMTTDTFPKLLSTEFTLPSTGKSIKYRMAGITKGAGMIHPNMATLLGLVCTDAPIHQEPLQTLLRNAADHSFNRISIDGDTSTNDTLAILANGAAGGEAVASMEPPDRKAMYHILTDFLLKLSHLVVRDGEGATKFVHVRVINVKHTVYAHRIAQAIATSPLVKTALNGEDANWGRILCAIGNVSKLPYGTVIPERTSVSFVPRKGSRDSTMLKLLVNGEPTKLDEARAKEILKEEDLEILVDLGEGKARTHTASYYTCDFSHEYISINADYRT